MTTDFGGTGRAWSTNCVNSRNVIGVWPRFAKYAICSRKRFAGTQRDLSREPAGGSPTLWYIKIGSPLAGKRHQAQRAARPEPAAAPAAQSQVTARPPRGARA